MSNPPLSVTSQPVPSKPGKTSFSLDVDLKREMHSSANNSKSPKTLEGNGDASPSFKRQRITRADTGNHKRVNYDMKHHPMDDVLRPRAAAKRRSYDQTFSDDRHEPILVKNPTTEMSKLIGGLVDQAMITPEPRRVIRAETLRGKVIDYDTQHHPLDNILRLTAAAKKRSYDQPFNQAPDDDDMDRSPNEYLDLGIFMSRSLPIKNHTPVIEDRRVTRAETLGGKPIDYDMKYHPMDDILRPKAAAKRRSYDHQPYQASNDDDNKGSLNEDAMSMSTDLLAYNHKSTINEDHRVTRAEASGGKSVDYNMKHHPIDDILRPKAAARRTVWFKPASPSTISQKASNAAISSPANRNDPKNPFTKPTPTDWKELRAFDRRVYLLQKGSPIHGNTSPLKWFKVVEALIQDSFFTREQLKAWGSVEALKERYGDIRVGVERFFDAKPEPTSKMAWQVVHAEWFEVFDDNKGNVVPPPSATGKSDTFEEQADSKNDDGEDDQEVGDSYDLRMANADVDKIDTDAGFPMRGGDAATSNLHHTRAISETSLVLYHNAEQFLQAEDHLMESMRSQPSSEIEPMMADDELDAVLGVMASPTPTKEATSGNLGPPSSLRSPDTLPEEPRQRAQSTCPKNNAAIASKALDSTAKAPSSIDETESIDSEIAGVVPPSVLKAARRIKQQRNQGQSSKQPRISTPNGLAGMGNSRIAHESLPTRMIPKKVYKRGSRAKSSGAGFQVHEDQPGNTPLIKKRVALHPKSPGTDIEKENIDHHSLVEAGATTAHARLQQAITRSPSMRRSLGTAAIPGTPGFERFSSVSIPQSLGFVVADGRVAGTDRMGPNAFLTPLTPRSARIRRV